MRCEDWPERLHEVIEASRARPFAWGEHDCTLFAADCVLAMTGVDHAAEWRGTYKTARSAKALINKQGGIEAIACRVGGEPIPVLMAQRGDGVLMHGDAGDALGICLGEVCAFVTLPDGLVFVPIDKCAAAWRV